MSSRANDSRPVSSEDNDSNSDQSSEYGEYVSDVGDCIEVAVSRLTEVSVRLLYSSSGRLPWARLMVGCV
jgi:hypothetical protein